MKTKLLILIILGVTLIGGALLLQIGSFGTNMLWNISKEGRWLPPLIFVSALIDSINPCAISILLITIAFLFSLGKNRSHILKTGGAYVFGLFLVYILIGLGILQILHLFNTPHFMAKIGAGILISWGALELLGGAFPNFPIKLKIPNAAHGKIAALMEKTSLPAAFGLGVLVGLCEFPCTGGPYLMVLGLLHDQTTFWSGLGYLFFYNIVFVLPLVVLLLIASHESLLEKVQAWRKSKIKGLKTISGIVMIILGIAIFSL